MPYLNLDISYFEHIKTIRLVGLLGKGSAELPLRLWCYCAKNCIVGNLKGYSTQEIEHIVCWWGKPGECVEALVKVRFIDKTSDGYTVHKWDEIQGHIQAFHERAKTAARARWGDKCLSNAKGGRLAMPLPTIPTNQPTKEEWFSRFWAIYPKKIGKGAAQRSWDKLKHQESLSVAILEAVKWQSKCRDWQKEGGQFIPHPATWLNQRRWEDEVEVQRSFAPNPMPQPPAPEPTVEVVCPKCGGKWRRLKSDEGDVCLKCTIPKIDLSAGRMK